MEEWIELLNYANEKLKDSKKDLVTYEEDSESDHQDGQSCGREDAYKDIIKHCAEKISHALFNWR